ncbi:MAG TPA: hypothetical protein EYP41_04875, partial [Anaerolineae bacterium]|nr:hypothetical protein [Anaerolineae bacterium]
KLRPDLPIIVMSAQNTMMTALTATEKGAFEYIVAVREMALSCLERLKQLGAYEFNYSTGESYTLVLPAWVDATEMANVLSKLEEGSGDVYGRLARRDA